MVSTSMGKNVELKLKENVVRKEGIEVDPFKVEVVKEWPVPKSATEIRSFVGLAGYYKKFIKEFSSVVVPLTTLTKKNAKFVWGPECQSSFDQLKQALNRVPVLDMLSEQGEFVLYTDASKLGLGSVLCSMIELLDMRLDN
ncbi:putative mitochondrial protein AtMg00860 [Primulina tabacum]|uniref:putative mitochondrial protein AtMg00860 n=1 Tax=Primulina tabacum TaxID=48773 RepID=UPI003F5A8729